MKILKQEIEEHIGMFLMNWQMPDIIGDLNFLKTIRLLKEQQHDVKDIEKFLIQFVEQAA